MSEAQKKETPEHRTEQYEAPQGATSTHSLALSGGDRLDYASSAQWLPVYDKRQKPIAEIFHVSYVSAEDEADVTRPLTFVFNGGPGAASAYLHMGAVGPRRVVFNEDGSPSPPPVSIVDNVESWLPFTDLVFVDPVGTGFSRGIEQNGDSGSRDETDKSNPDSPFFGLNKDLESLSEFMQSYLSLHRRWESPVFIAGESYGGFRVARLVKMLQERYSVGLCGAILISPALEFSLLDASDYDVLPWVDTFPTMSLIAAAHGKHQASSASGTGPEAIETVRTVAERFAVTSLPALLASGNFMPAPEREEHFGIMSTYTGLSEALIRQNEGRVRTRTFSRELLRESRKVLGLYDGTITLTDAYPDREQYEGPDATLSTIDRIFGAGVNTQLRSAIGVRTEREYRLLSHEVNRSWKVDYDRHVLQTQIGATDELRYGMELNPYMKVRISHGIYDLVTPYFSAERLVANMKLDQASRSRLSLKHYPGGHMFYSRDQSRRDFTSDIRAFYTEALATRSETR